MKPGNATSNFNDLVASENGLPTLRSTAVGANEAAQARDDQRKRPADSTFDHHSLVSRAYRRSRNFKRDSTNLPWRSYTNIVAPMSNKIPTAGLTYHEAAASR